MSRFANLVRSIEGKDSAEFQAIVDMKRAARMQMIDDMPPDIRACIHDFGLPVVIACQQLGVTKARHIRHLVNTILDEFSPTRGSYSQQGIRTPISPGERE